MRGVPAPGPRITKGKLLRPADVGKHGLPGRTGGLPLVPVGVSGAVGNRPSRGGEQKGAPHFPPQTFLQRFDDNHK